MAEARHVISWRYHIVSIVAVILAVALGVLAGATVVGDRFVEQLRVRTDQAEQRATAAEAETNRLDQFLNATLPYLTNGTLARTNVVLVTQDPVDDAVYRQAITSLTDAGANVIARVTATPRLADPTSSADLAQVIHRPALADDALAPALASEVADRLANGPGVGEDVLDRAKAFLSVDLSPGVAVSQVGGPGTVVVVFAGGAGAPSPTIDSFLLPLAVRLAQSGQVALAVAEGLQSEYGLVSAVRDDDADFPDGAIVTVDDLDKPYGGVALTMGLAHLIASPGGGGDYGIRGSGPLPPAPTP